MEFLKELNVSFEEVFEGLANLYHEDLPNGIRICSWIPINKNYHLSVQASALHYSTPRAFVPLEDYSAFEVALIHKGELSSFKKVLKKFPRKDELNMDESVLGYVPKDLVNDIYLYLKKYL